MHKSKYLKDFQTRKSLNTSKLGAYKMQIAKKLNLPNKNRIRNN